MILREYIYIYIYIYIYSIVNCFENMLTPNTDTNCASQLKSENNLKTVFFIPSKDLISKFHGNVVIVEELIASKV